MATAINIADLVESNGKTVFQNNMEKNHDLSIGTLVEVKYDAWHDDGACEKVHARLWIVGHTRDCDGTPLYSLSKYKNIMFVDGSLKYHGDDGWWLKKDIVLNIANDMHSGFSRESLTPVEVTPELLKGVGSLQWEKNEKR